VNVFDYIYIAYLCFGACCVVGAVGILVYLGAKWVRGLREEAK
jgi:hypothetical protein